MKPGWDKTSWKGKMISPCQILLKKLIRIKLCYVNAKNYIKITSQEKELDDLRERLCISFLSGCQFKSRSGLYCSRVISILWPICVWYHSPFSSSSNSNGDKIGIYYLCLLYPGPFLMTKPDSLYGWHFVLKSHIRNCSPLGRN